MPHPNPDRRKSGIPSAGHLPWGSHFCLFYKTRKDLLDVLIPYFRAGLENHEFCVWVTSGALRERDAIKALEKSVPGFSRLSSARQIEIVPFRNWQARGGKSGKAVLSKIDKAIAAGFDGLRLACDFLPGRNGEKFINPCGMDFIPGNNVIAAFAYPRISFDALGLMDAVRNHRFALVRTAGKWEVIESAEARIAKDELKRSEEKLKSLFSSMSEGFAYHRILLDSRGRPSDYTFLQVNNAFEVLTGLKAKNILGKRVTAVLPGIEKDPAGWISRFGKVALSGNPAQFENYSEQLKRWYIVSAFSPHKGYFAVTFSDITDRKSAEEAIRLRNVTLGGINKVFHGAMSSSTEKEFGRKCLDVAIEVTDSKFGFIGETDPDGHFHDITVSDPVWDLCRMDDKTGHCCGPMADLKIHGLYGKVLLDRKGFFTNDPPVHPESIGTPEGHPVLTSFLGVPMIHAGRTIGMIGVANRENGYRVEDQYALEALSGAISQSLMHTRAEAALRASLSEKEILLKELAHRTKNNMQVIGSLISLQASALSDKTLLAAFADTQDRIRAMALVHEKLYRSGNVSSLEIREYLQDLVSSLLHAHQGMSGPVRAELDVDNLPFSIDEAIPCGLIVNELVSNSLKHAFPGGKSGTLFLSLKRRNGRVELSYRDDGPGLPEDLDPTRVKTLGLKLVYNLAVRQLRGAMSIKHVPVPEFLFTFKGFINLARNKG